MLIRGFLTLLCCLLASPAYAFPDNGVLDAFTGCVDTTTPPNSNWTNAPLFGVSSANVDCEDTAVSNNGGSAEADMYYDITAFNANQEAYFTILEVTALTVAVVYLRLANIGSLTTDGYAIVALDGTSVINIVRNDNGVNTQLGASISQAITAGDRVGGTAIGDQICAWFKDGAAAWTNIGCRTDATYSAGGFIGLTVEGDGTTGSLDDFGGGDVAEAGGPILQSPSLPIFLFQ